MIRLDALRFPIVVGETTATDLAAFVRDRGYTRVVVAIDASGAPFADALLRRVRPKPVRVEVAVRRRTLGAAAAVVDALAPLMLAESTLVVAVGNRVACDVVGFAAATLADGRVPYALVPTTLDGMVDGAIAAARTLDDARGFESISLAVPPVAVFCAIDALRGITARNAQRGLAALVRHGIIEGHDLFDGLETLAPHPLAKWPWETVVADSIAIKAMHITDAVEHPPSLDVLALGRRFATALARASDGRMDGGAADAVGMRAAGLLALRTGRFDTGDHLRVLSLLALLRLPLHAPDVDGDALLAAVREAPPRALTFVVPNAIGDVEADVAVPLAAVRAVAKRCASLPGNREFR